jgi:hypothetical protein
MPTGVKVRRARRADFARVRGLLGVDGVAARAERKRFRRLVSTLREDLYLAEREDDAALLGLAVIVYARGLGPPTAVVRQLRGTSEAAAGLLLECARARAIARGCARLELHLEPNGAVQAAFVASLVRAGWCEGPRTLMHTLSA